MKHMLHVVLYGACLVAIGCATTDNRSAIPGGTDIDVGCYALKAPPGVWEYSINVEDARIRFQQSSHWLGNLEGVTTIEVSRHQAAANLDARRVAVEHLDGEERMLRELARGQYRLAELTRAESTIAGRRHYSMTWRKTMDFMKHGLWREHGAIHLWFPPDFAARHVFFSFAMTEYYIAGSLVASDDLAQLDRVIESFAQNEWSEAAPHPE